MTREEAIHILDNLKPTNTKSSFDAYIVGKALTMAIKALEQKPKTGRWIKMFLTDTSDIDGQCSECGFIHKFIDGHTAQYNYCPNCGCRMFEPQESEE